MCVCYLLGAAELLASMPAVKVPVHAVGWEAWTSAPSNNTTTETQPNQPDAQQKCHRSRAPQSQTSRTTQHRPPSRTFTRSFSNCTMVSAMILTVRSSQNPSRTLPESLAAVLIVLCEIRGASQTFSMNSQSVTISFLMVTSSSTLLACLPPERRTRATSGKEGASHLTHDKRNQLPHTKRGWVR